MQRNWEIGSLVVIARSWTACGLALVPIFLAALAFTASASASISYKTQWGGPGDGDLVNPGGVATDSSGNVFVVDRGNSRIQKFDPSGTFIINWGSAGSGVGQFSGPSGIATNSSGNVFVADTFNNRIQKFTSSGTFITEWGSEGTGDGQFSYPRDIATNSSGDVLVVDEGNNRIQKFDSSGTFITKWGSEGSADGQFDIPSGITTDSSGNVYVAENNRIQKFDSSGTFITMWGNPGSGTGIGIVTDPLDSVFVVDKVNSLIQKFDPSGTFITNWGGYGSGDGQFVSPYGIATDSSGNVYVTDNNRIQKFFDSGFDQHILTTSKSGAGQGTITSAPAGINCGATCSHAFGDGTQVTLTATAASGSIFSGWSGPVCAGYGPCQVTLGDDQTATATFDDYVFVPPDGTPPDTIVYTGPTEDRIIDPNGFSGFGPFVTTNHATFTFAGIPASDTAKVQCGFFPGPLADCTSPKTFNNLSDGLYFVTFRAEDAAGNKDQTPVVESFVVDTVPPVVTISSGPSGVSTSAMPTATFQASELSVRFECQLDGSGFVLCGSPVSAPVTPGVHTFEVRGTDLAGNASVQSATRTWTFDPTSTTSGTSGTVPAGGVVTTDPINSGPTVERPATAAVLPPNGGAVEIVEGPSGGQVPTGFSVVGQRFSITAPDATVSEPLVLRFRLDSSALPAGVGIGGLTLLRDGIAAVNCSGQTLTATPDPCVASRDVLPDGDVLLTVLSSHASDWIVAYKPILQHTLTADKAGTGQGTIISSPAGIDCGTTCSQDYDEGTQVTLTANPKVGSTFMGWSGAGCSGRGTCQVTIASDQTATANFSGKAKISKVTVGGPRKVKRGKKATYKVKVKNTGNAVARGVKMKVSGKGVKAKMSVGKIAPGKTKKVKVKIRLKKPGMVKAVFKVTSNNAGGKTVKKKITVKK